MSNEEALAFTQTLLALLVFLLGSPVLLVLTTAEGRIRHLLHRRVPHLPIALLMLFTLLVIGGLVWSSGQPVETWASSFAPAVAHAAKVLAVTLVVFLAAFWVLGMKIDIPALIVWWIGVRLRWQFRFQRSLSDADIDDLIVLGETGSSQHEKRFVLLTIGAIFRRIGAADQYDGTVLSPLVRGLVKIIASEDRPGTTQNYQTAIEIINHLWTTVNERRFFNKRDATTLIETSSELGEAAVRSRHETVAVAFLNTIADETVLFRIGVAALRHDRNRIAVTALSKLEVAADEHDRLSKELIGLVAAFCASGAHAASWGRGFSRRLHRQYVPDEIRGAARRAVDEFSQVAEYRIADMITTHADALT